MALYKDYDGVTRPVERVGADVTRARNNLLEALRDRARASRDGEVTSDTKVAAVAEIYRETWDRCLEPRVGNLRVNDMRNVSIVNKAFASIRDNHGSGSAKMARTVLAGMCALMVRHDALDDNPAREIESLSKPKDKSGKKPGRVTPTNVGRVLGLFHESEDAARWDLVDMQDVLSGLGCRIGELLALDYDISIDPTTARSTSTGP